MKNCQNKEIIERGLQNRNIKLIWQKNEELILFDDTFFQYERVFEDPGTYKQIEDFVIKALDIDYKQFYS